MATKHIFTITTILFFAPLWLLGQNLLPPIYNYKVFEYNAAGQNWGLAVNEEGELFAANNKGLLYFNGEEWVLKKLPNNTIVRSVASVENRIYTGSYEEFGYWTKNNFGLLEYTSLTHLIKNHEFTNEEFWQIVPFGESILFRSFSTLYSYKNDQIKVLDPSLVLTNLTIHNNKVLVAAGNIGLFYLDDEAFVPIDDNTMLANKTITDFAPYQDGLLVGTKLNGSYIFKEGVLSPWNNKLNELLKKYQLNKIQTLDNGKIAFGTIKNGVYLYNEKTEQIKNLNRETGLQNNTVLAMAEFKDQLWVGLDNGLDRLHIDTPINYYFDHTGTVGTVYDMAFYEGALYLGSNTGIYYFEDNTLNFIEGSQGHVWDLLIMDGDLLAGHNTGTFKVNGHSLEKISTAAGGYQGVSIPEENNSFLQGTYTGILKYTKTINGEWLGERIKGVNFPVKQLCFENQNTLWGAHPYKGLFRFDLNQNFDEVSTIHEYGPEAISNDYNIKLFNIKNQIVIQSDGIWYKYNPILDEISPFEEFTPYNGEELIATNGDYFWFVNNSGDKQISYTDLKGSTLIIAEPNLKEKLVPDAENILKLNDSIYYLTLSDGFAGINLSELNKESDQFSIPTPSLKYFKDEKRLYDITSQLGTIPYGSSQEIAIQVAAPSLIQPKYYYELVGSKSQSAYTNEGSILLSNLPHGSYDLKVATVGMNNEKSDPKTISFEIAPPWHLSKMSLVAYFLAFLATVFLIRWYNRRKLKRKHEALKIKMQHEQEERLALLEKEKLEKEIKQKQKELARTTMSVAKKNELILELKDMLVMNKEAFTNRQRYRSLTKKLDSSINKDEDWKNFEVNFKELHEDFFENLLKQFPKLTPKDLKLCAYLKMNLSSKEIAPLMGISIRGVEIHRYRLRKKLHIDSSQNLSNFLIKFN